MVEIIEKNDKLFRLTELTEEDIVLEIEKLEKQVEVYKKFLPQEEEEVEESETSDNPNY